MNKNRTTILQQSFFSPGEKLKLIRYWKNIVTQFKLNITIKISLINFTPLIGENNFAETKCGFIYAHPIKKSVFGYLIVLNGN